MAHRSALVAVSTAQLAAGLAGQAVALRRRIPFDTPLMSGRPENVGRDSFLQGTAFSAPVVMLAAQGWAIVRLFTGPQKGARQVLHVLGTVMVAGYLLERQGRRRLSPGGLDPVETPVVASGLGLAAAMALLARGAR
jgi:hypothetical protein